MYQPPYLLSGKIFNEYHPDLNFKPLSKTLSSVIKIKKAAGFTLRLQETNTLT